MLRSPQTKDQRLQRFFGGEERRGVRSGGSKARCGWNGMDFTLADMRAILLLSIDNSYFVGSRIGSQSSLDEERPCLSVLLVRLLCARCIDRAAQITKVFTTRILSRTPSTASACRRDQVVGICCEVAGLVFS